MSKEMIFGNYNNKQLIWIPVYKNGSTYILKEPICKMCFDSGIKVYMESDVRRFIIEQFVPSAFTKEEQAMLVPNEKRFGDLAYLFSHAEIVTNKFKLNREIFKEKHAWWVSDHMNPDASDATATAIWKFGLTGEVNKHMQYGVRPCIKIKQI